MAIGKIKNKAMLWHQYPMVRIVIPFIIGIAISTYCNIPTYILFSLVFMSITLIQLSFVRIKDSWYSKVNNIIGCSILLLFVLGGIIWSYFQPITILIDSFQVKEFNFFIQTKGSIISLFDQAGIKDSNLATLSALTLGEKSMLSNELKNSFAQSGAMHILAVSGLHVGVIYLILSRGFAFILRLKGGRYFFSAALLVALWFYAFLTGMKPSVFRAVLMFSMFSLGKLCYKNPSPFNIVAASAFIMLLIDPTSLFNVGFQLSYLAVLSIIYFYPILIKLYAKLGVQNRLVTYFVEITIVSVSAQIGTFPFIAYYFSSYPLYSLVTNCVVSVLVVAIFSTLILYLATIILPLISEWIGLLLKSIVNMLNVVVSSVSKWNYATIDFWEFTWVELLLYFSVLLSACYSLHFKRSSWLMISLSLSCLFVIINIYQLY